LVVCEFRGEVVVDSFRELFIILGQSDLDWGVDSLLFVVDRVRVRDLNVQQSSIESCGYWDSAPYLCNSFYSVYSDWRSFVVDDLYFGRSQIQAYVSAAHIAS